MTMTSGQSATRPILLGKLKRYPSERCALVAGEGNVKHVDERHYPILALMTGFNSPEYIADHTGSDVATVQDVYRRYAGDLFLCNLSEWNKLKWCPNSQTYFNARGLTCNPKTGGELLSVDLLPPCDPWFCTGDELNWIRSLVAERMHRDLPENALFLANNGLVNGTFFWEVVAQGQVVMRIEFSGPQPKDWKVSTTDAFDSIDWSFSESRTWVEERDRHVRANATLIDALAKEATAFIEDVCERDDSLPLIYFSGGKESMVVLDLFRKAGVKAQLLFAGTGMDFPEDASFIQEYAQKLQSDVRDNELFQLHVEPGDTPRALELFKKHGNLGLGNMWCRSELKYPIRNRAVNKVMPNGVTVAFEGSRWYETDFRRSHPRVNNVTNIKGYDRSRQTWAHAVADWNGFDIWGYIYKENLAVNPLYERGFQRTTCWSCPLVNPYHLAQSKKHHPELWETIDEHVVHGFEQPGYEPTRTPF